MAYFSNSTDSDVLDMQCGNCPLGKGVCPVLQIQMLYNYDQLDVGQEKLRTAMSLLISNNGICQVREVLYESRDDHSRTTATAPLLREVR